jgi:hypothetical protein
MSVVAHPMACLELLVARMVGICASAAHHWRHKMLNPWLSLPFQAARLRWETQSIVMDQMWKLAGVGISDRKAAGDIVANATALPTGDSDAPKPPTSPVEEAVSANSSKHRQIVQKVMKIQKKRSLGSKRRPSK